ncbi:hypothetical protein JTE90_002978 [Oedothorax gibbosus]|uniref:Uncharacterized protein n=1 Tax=Oedothorax gibbosus TaxID=931172 RepID=A0AAV6VGB0_9ARAC|nr:hypothetical protein JTE90_002978 [Oedothorax gibbosus]
MTTRNKNYNRKMGKAASGAREKRISRQEQDFLIACSGFPEGTGKSGELIRPFPTCLRNPDSPEEGTGWSSRQKPDKLVRKWLLFRFGRWIPDKFRGQTISVVSFVVDFELAGLPCGWLNI